MESELEFCTIDQRVPGLQGTSDQAFKQNRIKISALLKYL